MSAAGGPFGRVRAGGSGGLSGPGGLDPGARVPGEPVLGGPLRDEEMPGGAGELRLPRLPGFREMALRRMAGGRRRPVGELTAPRQTARLPPTPGPAPRGTPP